MTRGLLPFVAAMTFMSISAAYVSIRQHTSAYVSILSIRGLLPLFSCDFFDAHFWGFTSRCYVSAYWRTYATGALKEAVPAVSMAISLLESWRRFSFITNGVTNWLCTCIWERERACVCVCAREGERERLSFINKASMHAQAHTGVGRGTQTHCWILAMFCGQQNIQAHKVARTHSPTQDG